jgi:hypothetical protein
VSGRPASNDASTPQVRVLLLDAPLEGVTEVSEERDHLMDVTGRRGGDDDFEHANLPVFGVAGPPPESGDPSDLLGLEER